VSSRKKKNSLEEKRMKRERRGKVDDEHWEA